ncbi:hypothetical protein E2C01_068866 [Portunus trituberculatus]|uniref:Secreted protein n=1 Tax=Portunus trituberculatus TaxID=210409 RepID=A0A5B7HZ24_PORTR|nr:hypothetical protein [Portunus trituberculatus]
MSVLVLVSFCPRILVSACLAGLHYRRGGRDDNLRHAEAWGSRSTSTLPLWRYQATVTAGPGNTGLGVTQQHKVATLAPTTRRTAPGPVPIRQCRDRLTVVTRHHSLTHPFGTRLTNHKAPLTHLPLRNKTHQSQGTTHSLAPQQQDPPIIRHHSLTHTSGTRPTDHKAQLTHSTLRNKTHQS